MIDDVSLVFCVTADVSVRERMVRRLDGLGTLVICTDLAELQAMIGGPIISGPARVATSPPRPRPPRLRSPSTQPQSPQPSAWPAGSASVTSPSTRSTTG